MSHDLHRRLGRLAADMDGTDLMGLRARVERRSRQLRNRRALAASAAALAGVAVLLVGGAVLLPRPDRAAPPLPATSATTTAPSTAAPPSAAPSGTPSATGHAQAPGTLYYLTLSPGQPIRLVAYTGGTSQTTGFGTATSKDVYARPSPDGTRLVVNTSPDHDRIAPGDLVVVSPGGARHTIAHDVRWDGGLTAVWTPDGKAVIADGVRYDAATGAHAPASGSLPYVVYSPDGSVRAYTSDTPSAVRVEQAGNGPRTVSVTGLAECEHAGCPTSVQSVSDDGRYLALGDVNSDPSHVFRTAVVFDTLAGRRVKLGHLEHVWFRAGGALVDSGAQLTLYDNDWKVLRTYPRPAGEDEKTRLFYAP
ncbi:TolB family protein [Dactylosporangium darangshiense]|uniref:TolB family protein n=1 Tax=Dactylosporangium darangshiense TaxID=579108 RepID=UPI003640AA43